MDETLRQKLRADFIDSALAKDVSGATCAFCASRSQPFALQVVRFAQDESTTLPREVVPLSRSYGTVRGSLPVCAACAPPCKRCNLPIRTSWTAKMVHALRALYPNATITAGEGYCRHGHPIKTLASLFKKVQLPYLGTGGRSSPASPADQFGAPLEHVSAPHSSAETSAPKESETTKSSHGQASFFAPSVSGLRSLPVDDLELEERRQKMLASKPQRRNFDSDEDFEEASGFWMSRQGRILAQIASQQRRRIGVTPFKGNWEALTGTLYAAWFLANPNGPTAFALGSIELPEGERLFLRSVHFMEDRAWLLGDLRGLLSDSGGDFGALIVRGIERGHTFMASRGEGEKTGFTAIPSFVITNGNPSLPPAFQKLVRTNLSQVDWGRELYLREKYGSDFFARAGEEAREAYEALKADPATDETFLRMLWLRYGNIVTFADWQPASYARLHGEASVIEAWWAHATHPKTLHAGILQLAEMWQGASQQVSASELQRLRLEGAFVPLAGVLQFFAQFQMPLVRQPSGGSAAS